MMATRWQDDEAFVAWMVEKGYVFWDTDARGRALHHSFASDGFPIFMWEAWRAGRGEYVGP